MRTARALALAGTLLLAACAAVDAPPAPRFDTGARWAVLPLSNHTETAGAGQRAAAVIDGVLRARGRADLVRAPATLAVESLLDSPDAAASHDKALAWARGAGVRYVVAGAVTEWRYKVGVDGEPAVGLALQVIDVQSGAPLWSATGARSGWSREALAAVAQKLVRDLVAPLGR